MINCNSRYVFCPINVGVFIDYENEASEIDMSKTVDSDFTLTKAESKRDNDVDLDAVKRRADEYEKKAANSSEEYKKSDDKTPISRYLTTNLVLTHCLKVFDYPSRLL